MIAEVPTGSIYHWCYKEGLKHTDLDEVSRAVMQAGKQMRDKDVQNYWNGWYNSDLYLGENKHSILDLDRWPRSSNTFFEMQYSEYPDHPYKDNPEIQNRWVPCSIEGRPLIKWSQGCMMKAEAQCYRGCKCLAENLKGSHHIAIDIDGDHGDDLDMDVINFGYGMSIMTETWLKPENNEGISPSMHLLFEVDHVIPTMHFANAHIDIIGNEKNSIRYLKTKVSNGIPMLKMTDEIWNVIVDYIRRKENR